MKVFISLESSDPVLAKIVLATVKAMVCAYPRTHSTYGGEMRIVEFEGKIIGPDMTVVSQEKGNNAKNGA